MTRRLLHLLLAGAIGLAVAAPSAADPASLRQRLTLAGAKRVAAAAVAEARRLDAGGAIAVVDDGGSLLYLEPSTTRSRPRRRWPSRRPAPRPRSARRPATSRTPSPKAARRWSPWAR